MAIKGRSEREEKLLEEIKEIINAGVKAKGDQDAVFKQTPDGKVVVKVE